MAGPDIHSVTRKPIMGKRYTVIFVFLTMIAGGAVVAEIRQLSGGKGDPAVPAGAVFGNQES